MLHALEPALPEVRPDLLLVYGDTNSTLGGALAGAQAQVPVAHVEAGMRSFDRAMPEEVNRVLTDHVSSLLLCSSETAVANLARESAVGRVELVGDVMVDVALVFAERARQRADVLDEHGVASRDFLSVPPHRAGPAANPSPPGRLSSRFLLCRGRLGFRW